MTVIFNKVKVIKKTMEDLIMDRFAEVWATILEKFNDVIAIIRAIFEGFGSIGGGNEGE